MSRTFPFIANSLNSLIIPMRRLQANDDGNSQRDETNSGGGPRML
jgi:hypothetical protein